MMEEGGRQGGKEWGMETGAGREVITEKGRRKRERTEGEWKGLREAGKKDGRTDELSKQATHT